jgi:ABC-2 type transport system permease protein
MIRQALLIGELARKDIRLFWNDRRGALLCFAVPILLASAFGAIFDRSGQAPAMCIPLLVVPGDDSPLTQRVLAGLQACDRLQVTRSDRAGALRRLGEQGSGVILILPPDLEHLTCLTRPAGATPPTVELLHHPGCGMEASLVQGLFTQVMLQQAAERLLGPLLPDQPTLSLRQPFEVSRVSVAGSGAARIDTYSHSFCGMSLQYLLFWGMDSGLLLLRERRQGIWRRLRAAPVPLASLLAGKVLATAAIALLQIAVTFGFGRLVFGVTVTGSWIGFVALALAAALLSAATGLLVAALGGSEGRARSVAILTILVLSMLGGLWLPSFLLPRWVQQLGLLAPTSWAVRGFEGVTWQGMGLGGALHCAGILLAFSTAFLLVALWGLRRSETRRGLEGGMA